MNKKSKLYMWEDLTYDELIETLKFNEIMFEYKGHTYLTASDMGYQACVERQDVETDEEFLANVVGFDTEEEMLHNYKFEDGKTLLEVFALPPGEIEYL